ncbi:hypothetical protein FACS189499_05810 [Clostridia bacterium]|nr:hypothetical protein FACS189499_05810 [Clostridia bacterium]
MLYGIKEIWYKRDNTLIPINKGVVKISEGVNRVARMYIDIKTINKTIKFNIAIGGSHPSPTPHIRLAIMTKYFTYKQEYGNYTIDLEGGTNVTTIKSTSSGAHNVTIEATNMPVPATIGLIQNTIQSHSTSNYLYTYVDGQLADTQFWTDDTLVGVSMDAQNYSPTPVLRLNLVNGEIVFERLI